MTPKTYKPPFPTVRVEWKDACMYHGWRPLSEALAKPLEPVQTTGFLIYEDADLVRVVQSYGLEDSRNEMQVDGVMVIPKGWLEKVSRASLRAK